MSEIKKILASGALVAAFYAGASSALEFSDYLNERDDQKNAVELSDNCADSGIIIRHAGSLLVKSNTRLIKIVGLSSAQELERTEAANHTMPVWQLDKAYFNPKNTLEEFSRAKHYNFKVLKCINSVKVNLGQDASSVVYVPRQTIKSRQSVYITKRGDTPYGISINVCGSPNYRKTIGNYDFTQHPIIPGDVIELKCPLKKTHLDNLKPVDPSKKLPEKTINKSKKTILKPETIVIEPEVAKFVHKYKKFAELTEKIYKVPSNIVLAMAILESDYGRSELALRANNFHGLKANSEWHGKIYKKITKEHVRRNLLKSSEIVGKPLLLADGENYEVNIVAKFKKFKTKENGFLGFGQHLRTRKGGKAYADAFETKDPRKFLEALFDDEGSKYATDIAYIQKIKRILRQVEASRTAQ